MSVARAVGVSTPDPPSHTPPAPDPPAPDPPAPDPCCTSRSRRGAVIHRLRQAPARAAVVMHTYGTQTGQSTVEYALVLLGAAAVALALVAWVTRSDAVGRLFDAVVGRILERAG